MSKFTEPLKEIWMVASCSHFVGRKTLRGQSLSPDPLALHIAEFCNWNLTLRVFVTRLSIFFGNALICKEYLAVYIDAQQSLHGPWGHIVGFVIKWLDPGGTANPYEPNSLCVQPEEGTSSLRPSLSALPPFKCDLESITVPIGKWKHITNTEKQDLASWYTKLKWLVIPSVPRISSEFSWERTAYCWGVRMFTTMDD